MTIMNQSHPEKKKTTTTTTTKSKSKSEKKGDSVIYDTQVKKQEKWETPDKLDQLTKSITLCVALVE